MNKGLAIVIGMDKGKAKGKPFAASDEADSVAEGESQGSSPHGSASSDEDHPASLAFDALKDDDKQGFIDAFKLAVKRCKDDYADEEEAE